jgi:hypothetical protein
MNRSASGPESESFNTYFEYNRVLRTWFVAFGIGGPALFLVNDALAQRLVEVGRLRLVVVLFLIGVAAQVVGAFINKVANWYVFQANLDEEEEEEETWIHATAERIVRMFWIDVILDLSTIGVFGWAAWILFTVFAVEG